MAYEASARDQLECMLLDASVEPTSLPISLLESITNNFSDDQKIGSGGFAVVYKGQLQNGTVVAVKKLFNTIEMDEDKFIKEAGCLMKVKHKNIVRLLGYCADIQRTMFNYEGKTVLAERRQWLLCFEFLPKGGLDSYITGVSEGLEWMTRYQIIKGICEGLHYLHQQNIVHLDLKPANILLDHYMVPKIADFGLSKCFDEKQTRAVTSNVFGSLGYMAPESYGGVITFKSDIYSLGIIIIEILTGQKGYPQIENVLGSWSTRFETSLEETRLEPVRECTEIGIECTEFNPDKRPDIRRIIEKLAEMERKYGFMKSDVLSSSATNVKTDVFTSSATNEIGQCFLSKLATRKETSTVLKLDGLELSDSLLRAIGEGCVKLVEIGLSKCGGVTDQGISALVARCSHLETIDLTCCNLITNNALDSIAENCEMVECLRLESCTLINEKGIERIATCCPYLKEIDLTDCGVNDAALEHLAKCIELRILKLGLCSSISDKGLGFISSDCGKLVELDLYRCNSITDDGLAALASGCKRIKLLNLCYCNKITDSGLGHLGSLEELTNLELRCLVRVTDIGISSVAIGCKSLIELDLKRCYSVDDAAMRALARYALNLRQLTISYCQVTGFGLCDLLSSLRCLQDIKMVHLSWVSIEGLEKALRAACGWLKKLTMLSGLKTVLSPELLLMLQAFGCRIRWVNKPLVYKDG